MNSKDKKSHNWIQKAINPEHRGRCKNMGSAECPQGSRQYNLAITLRKMALKKHHGSSKKK